MMYKGVFTRNLMSSMFSNFIKSIRGDEPFLGDGFTEDTPPHVGI